MHNNAIERMFRHIAIGRRNWLHSGSHFAASNIGFMYSLLESCKLTFVPSEKINVIEFMRTDVLNRIKETLRKVVPAGGHAFFVWLAGLGRGTSRFGLGYIDLVGQAKNRGGGL